MTGARARIVHRPLPQDDPMQRCPDITRARETLGWEPRVPLETGLARTIAYFDDLLAGKRTAEEPRAVETETKAA
jgi:UDP-glucuronate decarboxylase